MFRRHDSESRSKKLPATPSRDSTAKNAYPLTTKAIIVSKVVVAVQTFPMKGTSVQREIENQTDATDSKARRSARTTLQKRDVLVGQATTRRTALAIAYHQLTYSRQRKRTILAKIIKPNGHPATAKVKSQNFSMSRLFITPIPYSASAPPLTTLAASFSCRERKYATLSSYARDRSVLLVASNFIFACDIRPSET